MSLGKLIQKLWKRDELSQETLAERMYVSRQSIDNLKNERSYPDIHNLIMLSAIFNFSLDELVKRDIEMMKYFGMLGLMVPLLLFIITMIAAYKVERLKKRYQLKTYRQIMGFYEVNRFVKNNLREKICR